IAECFTDGLHLTRCHTLALSKAKSQAAGSRAASRGWILPGKRSCARPDASSKIQKTPGQGNGDEQKEADDR
ncbi:MAG: hypothetical protein NTZ72_03415, partial [Afipia sp.]|nr:hypothetical protein [Afipia sp.]